MNGRNPHQARTARPRVSVLIPSYNQGRFLPEALDSVLEQDFQDMEIWISDDHSGDASAEVIRGYAARDPRIQFAIQDQNLGMVENWNWCLGRAKGTYIKFLFGDDRLSFPWAIGRMVELLETHEQASLAVSARDIIDVHTTVVDRWDHLGDEGLKPGLETSRRCLREMRNLIGEPSVVLFRSAQAGNGFNETYRQLVDLEMWVRLLRNGDVIYTKEALAQFRLHPRQQTAVNRIRRIGEAEMVRLIRSHLGSVLPCGPCQTREDRKHLLETIRVLCRIPLDDEVGNLLALHLGLLSDLCLQSRLEREEKHHLFLTLQTLRRMFRNREEASIYVDLAGTLEPLFGRAEYASHWAAYRSARFLRDLTHSWRARRVGSAWPEPDRPCQGRKEGT